MCNSSYNRVKNKFEQFSSTITIDKQYVVITVIVYQPLNVYFTHLFVFVNAVDFKLLIFITFTSCLFYIFL